MEKNILIIDQRAEIYKSHLEPEFPSASFQATTSQEEAEAYIQNAHVLISIARFLEDRFFEQAQNLEWIQSLISGTDTLVANEFIKEDIRITSARGIHGPQMSELAFVHMLNLTRNYPRMLKNQENRVWDRWSQPLLHQKTVGILGIGIIAEELARKCKAFNMTVYGISATERPVEGIDRFYSRRELAKAAAEVDYLIILVPYSPETEKIVSAEVIGAMKPTAFLINLARGQVIDEDALMTALKENKIAGAGLDVYNQEPLPADHPIWRTENLLMTPKIGGMSDIYIEQVMPIVETNLRHYLNGESDKMINIVKR